MVTSLAAHLEEKEIGKGPNKSLLSEMKVYLFPQVEGELSRYFPDVKKTASFGQTTLHV
jgi:hypothetical protein